MSWFAGGRGPPDPPRAGVKSESDSLTSGGSTVMPMRRQDPRYLGRASLSSFTLGRRAALVPPGVVGCGVGGLPGAQAVAGGVGPVEGVAGERLDQPPQGVGLVVAEALVEAAGQKARLLLAHQRLDL